jgi:hypothetical protein
MLERIMRLGCALALTMCASAALGDDARVDSPPPLLAGDALGLSVFGDGRVAYEKARSTDGELAANEQPAPPAKIAPED